MRVELLSFSLGWLAEWLLGFGARVEAVEPPELRAAVREAALAIAVSYAEDLAVV